MHHVAAHFAHEHHELVLGILTNMASANNKSLDRIKRLFFDKKNAAIVQQFWAMLDKQLPNHGFDALTECPVSGDLILVKENLLETDSPF